MRGWGRRRRRLGCVKTALQTLQTQQTEMKGSALRQHDQGAHEVQGSSLRGDSESHVEVMTAGPQHNSARSLSRRLADVSLLF